MPKKISTTKGPVMSGGTDIPPIPAKIVYKYRYYCFACTGRVLYAVSPFKFTYQVCPNCGKVHDASNYQEENWMPMLPGETKE